MSEFVDYLREVFAALGPIETKRMFGGHGVYFEGVMFALVANDALYIKVDPTSAPEFAQHGCKPFEYAKDGKVVQMSYSSAPAHLFEDPQEAKRWAMRAIAAQRDKARPRRK